MLNTRRSTHVLYKINQETILTSCPLKAFVRHRLCIQPSQLLIENLLNKDLKLTNHFNCQAQFINGVSRVTSLIFTVLVPDRKLRASIIGLAYARGVYPVFFSLFV